MFGCDVQKPPAELLGLPNFSFQSCDVSKQADISATVEACAKAFNGRIDVLLNVAGISDSLGSVDSLDDEQYDRVVAVDLTGPIKLMRGVIPYMRAQKSGSIVNVSSRAGMGGGVAGVTYTASKHGLVSDSPSDDTRYRKQRQNFTAASFLLTRNCWEADWCHQERGLALPPRRNPVQCNLPWRYVGMSTTAICKPEAHD